MYFAKLSSTAKNTGIIGLFINTSWQQSYKKRYAAFFENNIKSVAIPKSVIYIGDRAFDWNGLESITVDKDNPAYKSVNGNLYTKDGKVLIQYANAKTDKEFRIPYGVTHIGAYAFSMSINLTSIRIPKSVTSIGENAFSNCYNLNNIYYEGTEKMWENIKPHELPSGVKVYYNQ